VDDFFFDGAADFFAEDFFAEDFFAGDFFTADFFAEDFFAADFFRVVFFAFSARAAAFFRAIARFRFRKSAIGSMIEPRQFAAPQRQRYCISSFSVSSPLRS